MTYPKPKNNATPVPWTQLSHAPFMTALNALNSEELTTTGRIWQAQSEFGRRTNQAQLRFTITSPVTAISHHIFEQLLRHPVCGPQHLT